MCRIFTRKEAAEFLCISIRTLDRKREEGILPFHKIGDRIVFTESDINAFLDTCASQRKATEDEK